MTDTATTTKTEVGTANPFPISMPAPNDTMNMAYGIPFAVGAAIFAVLKLANKFSRDKVGYTGDRAEEKLIKMLQEQNEKLIAERDKAMKTAEEAWDTRTDDAAMIGELKATNKHLSDTVDKLAAEVTKLRSDVHTLRNELAKRPIKP